MWLRSSVVLSYEYLEFYLFLSLVLFWRKQCVVLCSNCIQFVTWAATSFFSCPVMSDFCDPMDCSTPGLPVLHHILEFAQVHIHCISDTIQQFHPLMTPCPSALNLYQHQGLFQWIVCIRWLKQWSFEGINSFGETNPWINMICFSISFLNGKTTAILWTRANDLIVTPQRTGLRRTLRMYLYTISGLLLLLP